MQRVLQRRRLGRVGRLVGGAVCALLGLLGSREAAGEEPPRRDGPAWTRHVIDDSSRGADGVKIGDLNRDGLADLVTGWEEGGVTRVYLHPGYDAVRRHWPAVTVGRTPQVEDAIFADLDGDGQLEVVSCTEGRDRSVTWSRLVDGAAGAPLEARILNAANWRTVAFPALQSRQAWMQAASANVDAIHGPDLILGSKNEGAAIGWLAAPANPADLNAWRYQLLRPAGWIMSLKPHDLDGDGDLDLVFSDRKGPRRGAYWLEHPGPEAVRRQAPWPEHVIGAVGREVMFLDVGDVNGDGLLDAAVAVKPRDVLIAYGQAAGGFRARVLTLAADGLGDAKAVQIADLNGDGRPDLVFSCEHAEGERRGLVWIEQLASGGWLQHPLADRAGVKFDLIQVLDLDGDGRLDVLTCEEREQLGVVWYEAPGG